MFRHAVDEVRERAQIRFDLFACSVTPRNQGAAVCANMPEHARRGEILGKLIHSAVLVPIQPAHVIEVGGTDACERRAVEQRRKQAVASHDVRIGELCEVCAHGIRRHLGGLS